LVDLRTAGAVLIRNHVAIEQGAGAPLAGRSFLAELLDAGRVALAERTKRRANTLARDAAVTLAVGLDHGEGVGARGGAGTGRAARGAAGGSGARGPAGRASALGGGAGLDGARHARSAGARRAP